ncbi:MAG: ABC transporter ATP-binding protein, partial [Chloroflexia bacterium]|nr:ABC transporter ATP-binding protein [Chloroflexia bacterium]
EAFQRKCMERIYGFRRAGKTIIFVSHALEVVRSLCDVAVWLDHGEQRADGPAGMVIDAYLAEVNRKEKIRLEHERTREGEAGEEDPSEATESLFRRGTREVEFVRVQLLDENGEERAVFHTGKPLTIRMHYEAHEPITEPVFGVGIYHESGIWISGPNTGFDSVAIPRIMGQGFIDYVVNDLPLLTGRYSLSVAVVDSTQLHVFDLHDRLYQIVVHNDTGRERYGMLALRGVWRCDA